MFIQDTDSNLNTKKKKMTNYEHIFTAQSCIIDTLEVYQNH